MSIEQAIQAAVSEAVQPLVAKIDELEAEIRELRGSTSQFGDEEQLFDYAEAAQYLGVPEKTLVHYVYTGQIGSIKVGRRRKFSRRQLLDWLAEHREDPVCPSR